MTCRSRFMFSCLAVLLLTATPVICLTAPGARWVPLPKFAGGINIMVDREQVPEGQLLQATNFIWRNDRLEGRDGFQRFAAPLTNRGVKFIDLFQNSSGAAYLFYSDGARLWYRSGFADASVELSFGRNNVGVVDTWGTYVSGDTVLAQKWRSTVGTGEGSIITIGSTDYTIDKIILDTLLWVTSTAGNTTDQTYNIEHEAININSGVAVSDDYWIYSNAGKFYFNRPDSFIVVDSLSGLRFQYSAASRRCGSGNLPMLRIVSAAVATNYAGKFLRLVTNPKAAASPKNAVTAAYHYYMSYPIVSSGGGIVWTLANAFCPDTATAQYFTVEALTYDSTTKFTTKVDSVRLIAQDSAGFSCLGTEALALKVYCDTCHFTSDTTDFITGDWFFVPNYAWTNIAQTYQPGYLPKSVTTVFPVAGGFVDADNAIRVAMPASYGSRDDHDIDSNNCSVTFYRMKKNTQADRIGGYRIAVLHKERIFEVRSDYPDRVYWSEPFLPDSFYAGSVAILDQLHPITAAAEQFGELVVYTTGGRWKMFPDATGTLFGKQKMDGSRGCVARGSFLNIDEVHYGMSADGYWETAGNAPEIISGAVESYFTDSISVDDYDDIRAGYDAGNDNIWISSNTFTLVYHRPTKSWWRQSFVAGAYAYNGEVSLSDTVRFIAGGSDSSTLYINRGRLDDGAAFTASLKTPYLAFEQPNFVKRLRSLMMSYESEVASAVTVLGYRDFGLDSFDTVTFTTAAVWTQKWLRVRDAKYRGNNIALTLSFANAGRIKLNRFGLQVILGGAEE